MILVILRKTLKHSPLCDSYYTAPNCRLHVQFLLTKLNCGKAKVDLS